MTHLDPRPLVGAYVIARLIQAALSAPKRWDPMANLLELAIEEAEFAENTLIAQAHDDADRISKSLRRLIGNLNGDAKSIAEACGGATSYVCYSVPFVVGLLASKAVALGRSQRSTVCCNA